MSDYIYQSTELKSVFQWHRCHLLPAVEMEGHSIWLGKKTGTYFILRQWREQSWDLKVWLEPRKSFQLQTELHRSNIWEWQKIEIVENCCVIQVWGDKSVQ